MLINNVLAKKLELLCVILLVSRFIKYMSSFDDVRLNTSNSIDNAQLTETIYRQRKTLETIFRILDTDNSGIYYCLTPNTAALGTGRNTSIQKMAVLGVTYWA